MSGNFIQKAIKRKGQLHRDLGVPQDQTIPPDMIDMAAKKPGKIGMRARFAKVLMAMHQKRSGKTA